MVDIGSGAQKEMMIEITEEISKLHPELVKSDDNIRKVERQEERTPTANTR